METAFYLKGNRSSGSGSEMQELQHFCVSAWQSSDRNITPFTQGLPHPLGAPTGYRFAPSSTVNDLLQHSQQLCAPLLPVVASVASHGRAEKDNSLCLECQVNLDSFSVTLHTCLCFNNSTQCLLFSNVRCMMRSIGSHLLVFSGPFPQCIK